jgi:nitrogen fixation-related uncharacterized protein
MSARRILVTVGVFATLLAIAALWWRHGTEVFLSGLGGMLC